MSSNDLFDKYKNKFAIVDGRDYWNLFEIITAGLFLLLSYGFNVWAYFYKLGVGIGISISLLILTLLATWGLRVQLKLRPICKDICESGKLQRAEVLDYTTRVAGRTIYSDVKLRYEDGTESSTVFSCGKIGMKKYKKYGVAIIQSKKPSKVILLRVTKNI